MKLFWIIAFSVLMVGCSQDRSTADLRTFMDQELSIPPRKVPPLPEFTPYEAFSYKAATMRSPFETPVEVKRRLEQIASKTSVTPDFSRQKELLEDFALGAMAMVGSLKMNKDDLFALISVDEGGVHRIKEGNYLGKNHGKIINISSSQIDLVEIVPDGSGGWIERPRTMVLKGASSSAGVE